MESSAGTLGKHAVDAATLAEAFRLTAARHADDLAIRTKGDAVRITWGELRERVDALAGGLAALGLRRGDTVALMLSNRPEFHLCDLAVMTVGATPFSIYETYAAGQVAHVLGDSEARFAFVEQSHLEVLEAARQDCPLLEHLIVVDGDPPPHALALADVEGTSNPDFDAAQSVAQIKGDDVLTLIYTSGTTGPPKGVELSHRNLIAAATGIQEVVGLVEGARVISWLPAAHVAERAAHHYGPILYALEITTCPDAREVMAYLPEVRPQWFFAVPRIWEKLKAGLEVMLAGQPEEQRAPLESALKDGLEKVRLEQASEPVPEDSAARHAKADAEIFTGLRAMLGLDQALAIHVGSAPTPIDVLEFFHAIGLPLAELWGMSETCAAGTINPPQRIKIGTVGPPAPGIEISLAADREVLIRGDVVMLGYRNQPEHTAETIDSEGWLHTGDVGELDDDGYLTIVDRKKELIINARGKNMSPTNIESQLKSSSALIAHACAIGDRRSYNTALIVLDADFAPPWATKAGIEDTSLESLAGDERVRTAVAEAVERANTKLSRVERIKRFTIVEGDWAAGGDELTPTMKLKRKPIAEKYAAAIEAMYAD